MQIHTKNFQRANEIVINMSTKKFYALFIVLSSIMLTGCVNIGQQSQSSKYDRTPYAVYVYDGNKEIVLYDNPKTASVDGKSGRWSESCFHFYASYVGGDRKTIYVVWYGSETLVISPGEELVFFGTEKQASDNEDNKYKWKDCEKKRL